jgi:L-alanine-DL-glutamate epimerase-like enolase superfamily enzyme
MKITAIQTFTCDVFRTNWVFVKVLTDEGLYGVGESTLEMRDLAVAQAVQELERYAVNGIPHLELFDAGGGNVGHAIGARSPEELTALSTALLAAEPLPRLAGVGAVSRLDGAGTAAAADSAAKATAIAPRSHG